ncbi:hypothetical protein E2C01_057496 [Portunus trituberculatus]|uniref:Uncharacterized protein n=1 Tax=Portunus trituberculatus TaxID=210409 RepID=A0A5B7H2K4_PORTR|nr:hypothetical protein [Portunus trituberculatus]
MSSLSARYSWISIACGVEDPANDPPGFVCCLRDVLLESSIITHLDTKTLDRMAWYDLLMSPCVEFGGVFYFSVGSKPQ